MSIRNLYRDLLPKSKRDNSEVLPKAFRPSARPNFPEQPVGAGGNGETIPHNGVPPIQGNRFSAVQGQLESLDALSLNVASSAVQQHQTLKSLPDVMRAARGPRTRFFDPLALVYATGFRDRRFSLTYDTIRRTTYQLSLLGSIIHTRIKQVSAFSQPYRENRQIGFRIGFKDDLHTPTEEEQKAILELERMISQCGYADNPFASQPRDDFRTFLEKITRDSLSFDQTCFEIIPDSQGRPFEFRAVDAATIRLAATYEGRKPTSNEPRKFHIGKEFSDRWRKEYGDEFSFYGEGVFTVQVIHGRIENIYTHNDLAFGIRNPRTDIWVNGYGFCLHPESMISTSVGMVPVEKLAGREFWVDLAGEKIPAIAFKTGERPVMELRFTDGRTIKASPEHRFYVLGENGEFDWKELKDISSGDVVASDVTPIEGGHSCRSFEYQHKAGQSSKPWSIDKPRADLWELVGWMCGDGIFRKKDKWCHEILLSYYKHKEAFVLARHLNILKDYGLPTSMYEREDGVVTIKFTHAGFSQWLIDQAGMEPVEKGYRVGRLPSRVFCLPIEERCAFLKGLFSADGHIGTSGTPHLGCTDAGLLQDAQRLLWSVGIRSTWNHDKTKKRFNGIEKEYDDGKMWVYDKEPFFEKIGFLQDHKTPVLECYQGTRGDRVGEAFARRCASVMKSAGDNSRRVRGLLERPAQWEVTRGWLDKHLPDGCSERDDLKWHHGVVDFVVDTGESVEMYDVSVHDDFHGFAAEGAVVHNSEVEMCLNTVMRMLWAESYNAKNFQQGNMANGVLNFKGETYDPAQLESFRRTMRAQAIGVENSHRLPIMQVPEGMEFVSFMRGNKEMEYGRWLEYLLKTISGMYQIDPTEINFDIGKANSGGSPLFETKQEWRIKYSRDKGLRPLLKFIADQLTKYVIEPLDNRLFLDFVGLDQLSEPDRVTMLNSRSKWMTYNEIRREEGLDAVEGGDVLADPGYQQIYLTKQQMGGGDELRENANPFAPWYAAGDHDPDEPENVTPIPLYLQRGGDEFGAEGQAGMMPGMAPPGIMPPGPMGPSGPSLPPPTGGAAGGIEE